MLAVVRENKPEYADLAAQEIIAMGELGPATNWTAALRGDVAVIFHLAARVHVLKETAVDPAVEFERVNVGVTTALARAAGGRAQRFIFVSSLHAMRTLADERLTEASDCLPDGPYGQSKLDAEATVRSIGMETGLETAIVRPPPVYGPGQAGRLMRLFQLVRQGLPLPLGGLSNRRSLVFVDNLVDSLIECGVNPRANGQTFLISDGEDVSLPELVRRMGQAFGRRTWLFPAPIRMLRATAKITGKSVALTRLLGSLTVDSKFIREQLGWQAPFTMDEGLKVTANWMKGAA